MPGLVLSGYTSLQNGASTSTGFARVTNFRGNEINFNFEVAIWLTQDAYNAELQPIDYRNYTIPAVVYLQ